MTLDDVEAIKDDLRSCTTVAQVKLRWSLRWSKIQDMKALGGDFFVLALQCKNLAEVMIVRLEEGWVPPASGGKHA